MKLTSFLLLVVLSAGCAIRFQTDPAGFEMGVLYSRITNCTAKDVPPPLVPDAKPNVTTRPPTRMMVEGQQTSMTVEGQQTTCQTLEVGAKSYQDSITAIGIAVAAILAKVALF